MFISREKELELLQDRLNNIQTTSNGKILFVTGDMGIGKTSLISEFLVSASKSIPTLVVATGQCSELTGKGIPYQVIQEISSELISHKSKDIAELFVEVAPAWLSVIPGIGSLLGAILETSIAAKNKIANAKEYKSEEVFFQLYDFFKRVSQNRMLILVIEDIQWIDNSSLNFLFFLVYKINKLRLLIICSQRTGEAVEDKRKYISKLIDECIRNKSGEVVALEAFSENEVSLFSKIRLGTKASSSLIQDFANKSGGNPLYLDTIIGAYINGSYEKKQGDHLINSIIKLRFHNIAGYSMSILKMASTYGYTFNDAVLCAATKEIDGKAGEIDCFQNIAELTIEHKLFTKNDIFKTNYYFRDNYRFSHQLVKDYLYEELSESARVKYHQIFAKILKLFNLDINMQAYHNFHGRNFKEAALLYYTIAITNRAISALEEAKYNLNMAIEALSYLKDGEARLLLVDCYQLKAHIIGTAQGNFYEGINLYQKVIELRNDFKNQNEYIVDCYHMMGVCFSNLKDYQKAQNAFESALKLLPNKKVYETNYQDREPPLGNKPGQVTERQGNIYRDLGRTYFFENNHLKALEYYKKSYENLINSGDPEGYADTLYFLGDLNIILKNYEQAKVNFGSALEIRERAKLFYHQLTILKSMSKLAFIMDDGALGRQYLKQAIDIGREYKIYYELNSVLDISFNENLKSKKFKVAFENCGEKILVSSFLGENAENETTKILSDLIDYFIEKNERGLINFLYNILIKYTERLDKSEYQKRINDLLTKSIHKFANS